MAIYPVGNTVDLCLEGPSFKWAFPTDHKALKRRDAGRDIFRISCRWIFRVLCRHMPSTTSDQGISLPSDESNPPVSPCRMPRLNLCWGLALQTLRITPTKYSLNTLPLQQTETLCYTMDVPKTPPQDSNPVSKNSPGARTGAFQSSKSISDKYIKYLSFTLDASSGTRFLDSMTIRGMVIQRSPERQRRGALSILRSRFWQKLSPSFGPLGQTSRRD
jgi:hypothetical protein